MLIPAASAPVGVCWISVRGHRKEGRQGSIFTAASVFTSSSSLIYLSSQAFPGNVNVCVMLPCPNWQHNTPKIEKRTHHNFPTKRSLDIRLGVEAQINYKYNWIIHWFTTEWEEKSASFSSLNTLSSNNYPIPKNCFPISTAANHVVKLPLT